MNKKISAYIGILALLLTQQAQAVSDSCDGFGLLSGINPFASGDFVASGSVASDYFGASSATGDFDGDGQLDLVIGATGTDFNGSRSGAAYVFYGPLAAGTPVAASTADALFFGASGGQEAGFAVANAGDVDGDGIDDLLIGAPSSAGMNGTGWRGVGPVHTQTSPYASATGHARTEAAGT
jgi:hypothetical protein